MFQIMAVTAVFHERESPVVGSSGVNIAIFYNVLISLFIIDLTFSVRAFQSHPLIMLILLTPYIL